MDESKRSNAGSPSPKGASGAGRAHRANAIHAANRARQSDFELGRRRPADTDAQCNNDEEWWRSDDSESSDGSEGGGTARGRRMPGADGSDAEGDRFLDPGADDLDEAWVLEQCGGRRSDAILSCPGCLTTLCVDCQQHAKFPNQWRAMFVMNCLIGSGKAASAAPTDRRGASAGEKRRLEEEGPGDTAPSMGVGGADGGAEAAQAEQPVPPAPGERPLLCEVCDTEVGTVDEEDICHFFNVFPSNA